MEERRAQHSVWHPAVIGEEDEARALFIEPAHGENSLGKIKGGDDVVGDGLISRADDASQGREGGREGGVGGKGEGSGRGRPIGGRKEGRREGGREAAVPWLPVLDMNKLLRWRGGGGARGGGGGGGGREGGRGQDDVGFPGDALVVKREGVTGVNFCARLSHLEEGRG